MPSINKTPNIGLSQWQSNEYIKRQDVVNDNAAIDSAIGNRTIDDTKIPSSDNHTSLSMLLSWLGNMIRSITGKSNWRTAPVKSIEQLNNDIVAHEAEITSLQNEVQNTLARASVSLSNTAPVQSFTADVAGPVDVEFRAPEMIVNSVANGNFANGTTGWNAANSSITASNNTLSNTGNGGSANPYFKTSNTIIASVHGKKIYSKARVRVTNANCLSISFALRYGTTNFPTAAYGNPQINNPVQNQWYNISSIVALNSSDTGFSSDCIVLTQHSYADSATANGKVMEVQQAMAVDLTAIFGSGNEPDIDWCDANISYVNGIQPLVNPMVKICGKNLFDGNFFQGYPSGSVSPNGLSTLNPISVIAGRHYVVNWNCNKSGELDITTYDKYMQEIRHFVYIGTANTPCIVTIASNERYMKIHQYNATGVSPTNIINIQIEEGVSATAYEPHKESPIILNGEFCKIGSYTDTVKLENGVAKKLAAVKKVMLDGSLPFTYGTDLTGVKYFTSTLPLTSVGLSSVAGLLGQKHDGKILTPNGNPTSGDCIVISSSDKVTFGITVNDTESGFGETYTPTMMEIQALMNGWKMNNGTFGTPYNGTGTKTWITWNATSNVGAVTIVPTTKTPGWTGWATLWYALATPVEEIIQTAGSLGCFAGQNAIFVNTGMMYEKANPIQRTLGLNYFINIDDPIYPGVYTASKFKYKTNLIISILKNGAIDKNWIISTRDTAYGKYYAEILPSNYDPTAEYYVLYQILPEEYNNQQISLKTYYPSNLRGAHNALAETVTNIGKELSDVWVELLPLADKEIAMAAIPNLITNTNTDLQNKINEILNVW